MSSEKNDRTCMTFSLRLTLWYAIFFSIAVVGLSIFSYLVLARSMRVKNGEVLDARVQEFRAWFEEGGLRGLENRLRENVLGQHEALFVRVLGRGGEVLYVSDPEGLSELKAILLSSRSAEDINTWIEVATRDEKEAWIVRLTPLGSGRALQVGMSVTQTRQLLSFYRTLLWLGGVPFCALGILGGWWLTHSSLKPVRQLMQTTREIIQEGDMARRVPVESQPGELRELVTLFNRLLERNQNLIRAMHDSLDMAAHDLKTPMTRLRNSAETALQSSGDLRITREALKDCLEESEQVLSMLDTLMDLAEAEAGSMRLDLAEVCLSDLVQSVVSLYELVAEEQQITISTELSQGLKILADRRRFQQALANLVDNAVKYSDAGGQIEIKTWEESGQARIAVIDRGMGISDSELPKIWERLYRGVRARSRRGLGLGLSFVKAIVEAHGGSVDVESALNKGSVFTVRVPAVPNT